MAQGVMDFRWIRIVTIAIIVSEVAASAVSMERPRRDKPRGRQLRSQGLLRNSDGDITEDLASESGFSSWSDWSRCSRRCRQVRTRMCLDTSKCDTRTQKHVQACDSANCKRKLMLMSASKDLKPGNYPSTENTNGNVSDFHVLFHLQDYIYSEWSEWSPCTSSCYTKRRKSCRLYDICGRNTVEEDAMCYRDGDICEQLYWERKNSMSNYTRKRIPARVHPLDALPCGVAQVNSSSTTSVSLRIIGGRKAVKDSWPWQVLILNKYRQAFCGGILLADSWVLTAAHCVRRRLYIRVGEYDLSLREGTEQEERVVNSFVYPDYDTETVDNDLALLRLRYPVTLNQHVQPVCLPSSDDELNLYARATILGWGKRRNDAKYGTEILHQAEVPIVPPEDCKNSYIDYYISENMLCAGFSVGKVDSCAGDSGGPLLYKQADGTWAVYGITSFGDGCGVKGKYGIYANVPNFASWIRGIIKELS